MSTCSLTSRWRCSSTKVMGQLSLHMSLLDKLSHIFMQQKIDTHAHSMAFLYLYLNISMIKKKHVEGQSRVSCSLFYPSLEG